MSRLRGGKYRRDPDDIVPMAWNHPWTPTEQELTDLFLEVAHALGWSRAYHTHDSRRSAPGFPDWVMVHPGQRRILFVELKGFGGLASEDQRAWLADINDAGGEGYLVTTSGDQARDLAAIADLLRSRPTRRVVPAVPDPGKASL